MPTSGEYIKGDYVEKTKTTLTEIGTVGSRYVVFGWTRMTTGNSHILGNDWLEDRRFTGN